MLFNISKLLEPGLQVYACKLCEGWGPLHKIYVNCVFKRVLMLNEVKEFAWKFCWVGGCILKVEA